MDGPRHDVERDIRDQEVPIPAHAEVADLENGRGLHLIHSWASVTSALTIESTFFCISISNLSAVYAPEAMWLIT